MDSTSNNSSSRPPSQLQQQPPSRAASGRRSLACGGAGGPSQGPQQQEQLQHRRRPPSRLQQEEAVVDRMEVDSRNNSTSKRSRSVTPPTRAGSRGAGGQQEGKRRRLVLHLLPRGQTPPPRSTTATTAATTQGQRSPAPFRRRSFTPPPILIPVTTTSASRAAEEEEEEEEEDQELADIAARIPPPPPPAPTNLDPRPSTPKQPPVLPESDHSCEEDATAQFTCPVCLSLLARPVTLECGFSLCEGCVAQALHHAWAVRSTRTAPCPVLGPSCPYPLARLPRVNALLHASLAQTFPTKYAERLAEARASPTHAITARVQAHSAKLSLRPYYIGGGGNGLRYRGRQRTGVPPPPAALALDGATEAGSAAASASTMGYDHGHEEGEEDLEDDGEILGPLLSHLRFSLPFLLALAVSLSLPPTTTPPHPSLASNAFALLLTSTLGSHWLVWSFLEATIGGSGIQGLGGFRHLLADVKLRVRLAGGFPPGLGFACTWLLLASVVELCSTWTRLAAARLRLLAAEETEDDDDPDDDSNSPVRWAVSELLILLGSWLWFELLSLAAFNLLRLCLLLPTSPGVIHALLTSPRIHRLYNTLWYTGVFIRIIVLPFLPKPRLTQHIRTLRALRRLPPWQAILLDPRIELLHSFSSLEARLLSRALSALKKRAILFLIQRQQHLQPGQAQQEREEEGEEEERVPTPRAPGVVVGREGGVPAH